MILDAKDAFSKQRLFEDAWKELYPGIIEWVSLSMGGKVSSVDPATMTVETDFEKHKAAVANIIPPQKAGRIAELAGVTDRTGWCPVDPATFESRLQSNIHIIGDACIAGAMPKSGFAANAQAKVCAAALVRLLSGQQPDELAARDRCERERHRQQRDAEPEASRLRDRLRIAEDDARPARHRPRPCR